MMDRTLDAVCARLSARRLPRWEELPDLELYMDQVLSLTERYLGGYPGFDRKGLTASMVNNYVKQGVVPPPVKKRYARAQLSRLLMVCVLKASLPIEAIRRLLPEEDGAAFYNAFCEGFEAAAGAAAEAARSAGNSALPPPCAAALRAQAEQALARELCAEGMKKSTD